MSFNAAASMRAVECVASFAIIGVVGYILTKRRWFSDETASALTRFLTSVIIPVNLFYNINASATAEDFLPILHYMLLPAASVLIVMILAMLAARPLGVSPEHRGVFITASSCSNTINIGLPINLALFGTDALPAVLLYFMGNTVVFWTLGNYLLAVGAPGAEKVPVFSATTGRRILSPPICGFLLGLTLLFLNVKIPPLLGIAGGQLAGMTTPLSILCIGITIFQTGIQNIRLTREIGFISMGRFVVSPLTVLCLAHFFPVPELMLQVFIIQSSLPPMANIALLAIKYKSDAGFASMAVTFGTLCALVTVPIFMMLLTSF